MLECLNNIVGIRATCNESPEPPKSGWYIDEDLAGLSFKKIANQADASSGIELINRALKFATDKVMNDILLFVPQNGAVYGKDFGLTKLRNEWQGWNTGIDVLGTTSESFSVRLKRPNEWVFSCVELGNLMIYPDQNITDFEISITDNDPDNYPQKRTRNYIVGDLLADEKHYFPLLDTEGLPINVVGDFTITTTQLDLVNCKKATYNCHVCNHCGGRTTDKNEDDFFFYSGNQMFFVELLSNCKTDQMFCYLFNNREFVSQLGKAIMYQAGMFLLTDMRHSTRENFYIQNLDQGAITDLEGRYLYQYEEIRTSYFPKIVESLEADKMCFICKGIRIVQGGL